MKCNLQIILLFCFLFLSSNKKSNSFDDNEQNDNYEDNNKFEETRVGNLKNGKEILEILDKLKEANDKFKILNTTEKVKEKFEEKAKTLFASIMIKYVLPATIPKVICSKVKCEKEGEELIGNVTEIIFDVIKKVFKKYDKNTPFKDKIIEDLIVDYTDDIILDQIKKLLSEYPYAADLLLSFSNLAWSCYEIYYTFKEISKIGLYKEKLERLKNRIDQIDTDSYFEFKLENDYDTIKDKINKKIKELQEIQKKLEELIITIEVSIEILRYQQDKSFLGFITGGISFFATLFGAILSGVDASLLISTILALNISLVDLIAAQIAIEKLKFILKEAKKEKEKLEKKIDELIKKTKAKFNKKKET